MGNSIYTHVMTVWVVVYSCLRTLKARTATMAALLLLTSGLVRYEADLHNTFFCIFVCVREGDGLE